MTTRDYQEPPRIEDTLPEGVNPLFQALLGIATEDWQTAMILFKARDGVLLIDWVQVTTGADEGSPHEP